MSTRSSSPLAKSTAQADAEQMMAKSLPKIPVPANAYESLAALVDLGPERVAKLAELASAKQGVVQLPNSLSRAISEWAQELKVPVGMLAKAVTNVIIPANGLRIEYDLRQPEFVEAFRESVKQRASDDWKKKYEDKWPEIAAALAPLFLPDNVFSVTMKVAQLLGSQAAVLLDAKVLTEMRPIYDEAAKRIQTFVRTNTLILTYHQDGCPHTIHVSMDSNDLRKMAVAIRRAEKKNVVAKDQAAAWGVDLLAVTAPES